MQGVKLFQSLRSYFEAPEPSAAEHCYRSLRAAARKPAFYAAFGVPDTLDGRFELLCLHAFLLQHRLHDTHPEFARQLSECFFQDMDTAWRELGIGDSGVKRRIKQMAKAYHGRLQVYAAALAQGKEAMKAALARNLYGTVEQGEVAHLEAMADYTLSTVALLAQCTESDVMRNGWSWPEPVAVRILSTH